MKKDCYIVILLDKHGIVEEITSYTTSDRAINDVVNLIENRFYEFNYSKDYIKEHTITHKQKIILDDGYSIQIHESVIYDDY